MGGLLRLEQHCYVFAGVLSAGQVMVSALAMMNPGGYSLEALFVMAPLSVLLGLLVVRIPGAGSAIPTGLALASSSAASLVALAVVLYLPSAGIPLVLVSIPVSLLVVVIVLARALSHFTPQGRREEGARVLAVLCGSLGLAAGLSVLAWQRIAAGASEPIEGLVLTLPATWALLATAVLLAASYLSGKDPEGTHVVRRPS